MKTFPILAAALAIVLSASCGSTDNNQYMDIAIGTYGHNLYQASFHKDGSFTDVKTIASENPSFVIVDPDGSMYAVSENDPSSGVYSFNGNSVTAFATNTDFGPCHLLKLGDMIYTADYGRGCISSFPVADGKVQDKVSYIQFNGSGPHPERQTHSYIHQLRLVPASIASSLGLKGDWILASDLGDDTIHVLCKQEGSDLQDCPDLMITLEDGTGPRHMEFNEKANMLYCISELGGMVYALKISSSEGKPVFTLVQSLKADLVDAGGSADIHMHPSGKFLYTSHRLVNDGIALFNVAEDGLLEMAGYFNTGVHPRNFQITPDGEFMLVACRDSYTIDAYTIDPETGALSEGPLGSLEFQSDQPVCIAFKN